MHRKFPEANTLALTEKTHRFLNFFSCRFHTLAYWLTFNSEILALLSHGKHTHVYVFMIDFMYILAPASPLNKAHLKARDLYFVKHLCFNMWFYFLQKRCKQKHCNSNRGCLAPLLAGQ